MNKLVYFISSMLVTSLAFANTPKSFTEIEKRFQNGSKPDLTKIAETTLQGGCFTPYSDALFKNDLDLMFTKNENNFDAIYTDQITGEKSEYASLVNLTDRYETKEQNVSQEAHFKMTYKYSDNVVIEKISLHNNGYPGEFIVNFCFYNL